jgi:hypothetical protein
MEGGSEVDIDALVINEDDANWKLWSQLHEQLGHAGVQKMRLALQDREAWSGSDEQLLSFARTCPTCQGVNQLSHNLAHPLVSAGMEDPLATWGMDIVGPLEPSKGGHRYLLVAVESSSKYPEALPLRSIKTKAVIGKLVKFHARYGIPRIIKTDRGSQLTSRMIKGFYETVGIKSAPTTAHHQQADPTEATIKQLKNTIAKLTGGSFWDRLQSALLCIRAQPNTATGKSPAELLFGVNVKLPVDLWAPKKAGVQDWFARRRALFDEAKQHIEAVDRRNMKNYNKRRRLWKFKVGDKVLMYNYYARPGDPKWLGPLAVEGEKAGAVTLQDTEDFQLKPGTHRVVNTQDLRPFHDRVFEQAAREPIDIEERSEEESALAEENGAVEDAAPDARATQASVQTQFTKVLSHREARSGLVTLIVKLSDGTTRACTLQEVEGMEDERSKLALERYRQKQQARGLWAGGETGA